jgi:hypothetical protein
MPRYLIHIGPHKTGTTYIQSRLDTARDRLRAVGVLYPTTWRASDVMPSHLRLFERIRRRELEPLRREVAALPVESDGLVVISSEDLQYLDEQEVRILFEALGTANVTIVYYCRRWSELLPSVWQERVKHGSDEPLVEFMLLQTAHAPRSAIANFAVVVDRYVGVFGAANIRVVSYSNLTDGQIDLADHFAATFLPLLPERLPQVPEARPNASLSIADMEMIRVLNALHRRHGAEPGSAIRDWYLRGRGTLDLSDITAAMTAHAVTIPFSDAIPVLDSLHRQLFARFRDLMVPPVATDRLFQPLRRNLGFVRQDYLADPTIVTRVGEIYRQFRAA